ncbi:hypothetical protein HII31_00189 [Pseudocercospora fuligena]|uniref:Uncharacterized protein n=1 Tax=Pseudocercospora fuligena TaxID=685502 RepID=A0A8H6RV59_9PEZI|nr:hypothetical protein HII31_00189 [Pseudocercospora fuligena]
MNPNYPYDSQAAARRELQRRNAEARRRLAEGDAYATRDIVPDYYARESAHNVDRLREEARQQGRSVNDLWQERRRGGASIAQYTGGAHHYGVALQGGRSRSRPVDRATPDHVRSAREMAGRPTPDPEVAAGASRSRSRGRSMYPGESSGQATYGHATSIHRRSESRGRSRPAVNHFGQPLAAVLAARSRSRSRSRPRQSTSRLPYGPADPAMYGMPVRRPDPYSSPYDLPASTRAAESSYQRRGPEAEFQDYTTHRRHESRRLHTPTSQGEARGYGGVPQGFGGLDLARGRPSSYEEDEQRRRQIEDWMRRQGRGY